MPWLHSLLYDDFAAYGIENFSFQILELCDEEQLNEREVYYIEKYNAYEDGLNSNNGIVEDLSRKERTQFKNQKKFDAFDWTEYLDKPLFKEQREEIVDSLQLKDLYSGHYRHFPFIENILQENGYTVTHKKKINKERSKVERCVIISKN